MRFLIRAENAGRVHLHADVPTMTLAQADVLDYYLRAVEGVTKVKVFDRTRDVIIRYESARKSLFDALARFDWDDAAAQALVPEHTSREIDREVANRFITKTMWHYGRKLFLPAPVRYAITTAQAVPYVIKGLKTLLRGHLAVSVLDATAITASLAQGDHATASSVMYLLGVGELLEEWARKKSVDDLAGMMALGVEKVWRVKDDTEELVMVSDVTAGDEIIVRTGSMIPLDGKVISGEAMVNQATMTGEPLPVKKAAGSYVYGGTVVEEGTCRLIVDKASGSGRYDRIVRMIEDSEALKSVTESKAAALADKLVPYSFAGTIISYLLTRNVNTAMAFLMVDYSCALKLTMPLAVMAAMREAGKYRITVKGGKFLEDISQADTIVFDKTGTLTNATPKVVKIIPFGDYDENEMLRFAACLEEHYPHSMANAVVKAAAERGLIHEERHTTVEYVVAHGITSTVDGQKASIGSYHYIFEDEKVKLRDEDQEKFESIPEEYSLLYLAIGGRLAAVICIEDPVRPDAADVIKKLHKSGFEHIVMMTGDSERAAAHVAGLTGVDEYLAEVLPEDKAHYARERRAAGHKVIMIGDGVNDAPALSEADVGIAVNSGAAIAREISDITIESEDLHSLVTLKKLADSLMKRISADYRVIIAFNSLLITLGAAGILAPTSSALLHNGSTLLISLHNRRDLLV